MDTMSLPTNATRGWREADAEDPAGKVFFNDQPVTPTQLAERLAQAGRQNPETEVQLRADQAVPYGRVVEVMGAAQKAGLNRIGFVAEPGLGK